MKLGISIGYSGGRVELPLDRVLEAEQLGYDSLWTAEAYGSDAVTPLAYLAAKTTRIKLGTGIMQLAGRTPAMCAMTMSTLDALSGGRVLVGLGLSGPQVVEGWHGMPYDKPVARLREYVQILRKIWAREEPVALDGQAYQLPYHGPGATGLGKPLKSILHSRQLPVYLATMQPLSVRLTAELADGWLPIWFSPQRLAMFRLAIEEGFKRAGNGKSWKDFDIAARIQELYLSGRKAEAIAAVPDELCDELSLCGPEARIRQRYKAWEDGGVTTMLVQTNQREALHLMADVAGTKR
ncbi:MAG TPA: LLM class flavin-dependent oxidoreductase [Candidatus Binatia bacterium]|nr:LLM class flavin-dependent oxidoreductase [Candidatus Binatia bacterium]